jgi:hypothetical protein
VMFRGGTVRSKVMSVQLSENGLHLSVSMVSSGNRCTPVTKKTAIKISERLAPLNVIYILYTLYRCLLMTDPPPRQRGRPTPNTETVKQ